MSDDLRFLRGMVLLGLMIAGVIWFFVRWLKASEDDPGRLVSKWVITALVLGIVLKTAVGMEGFAGAVVIPLTAMTAGLVLTPLWAPNIGGWFAGLFTSGIDGGDEKPEDRPLYSVAEGHRRRGRYAEAVAEIRRQMERFPTDFQGQMLLAEIQANDLRDYPAAAATLERLSNQTVHSPKNRAFALNHLADWHLKFGNDPDSARGALERIQQLFPGTELANLAAQRLAHLVDPRTSAPGEDRAPLILRRAEDPLAPPPESLVVADTDPLTVAEQLIRRLGQHPLDYEARELLAEVYAERMDRVDLAVDQLEQLIAHPNQPPRQIAKWLNRIADFHIRFTGDRAAATAALQRVIDAFPETASGEKARTRLANLGLDLRAKQKSQVVKLGSYENDLGLKRRD